MNKNFLTYLILISVLLGFTACKPQETKVELMKKEVLRLHDVETMPKMAEVIKLTKQLTQVRTQLAVLPSPDTLALGRLDAGINSLKAADKNMMDWMQQFKMVPKGTQDEQMVYFTDELEKIKLVEALINSSIDNAHALLKEFKPEM
jgi:hypothetical protein